MLSGLQPFFFIHEKVRKSRFSYRFTRSSSHQILVLGLVGKKKTIKSGYFHEFESNVPCVRPPAGRAAALLSRCEMIVEGAGGDNK